MASNSAACPIDSASRAQQCQACCYQNSTVPPCVASYLRGDESGTQPVNRVVPIRRTQVFAERRAA